MEKRPQDHLIVALDVPNAAAAMRLADQLAGTVQWVKVGLELYLAEGRSIVEALVQRDFRVFLDLKLHDIPNTVASAVQSVSSLGTSLLTIHTLGGRKMLEAAAEAAAITPGAPRLLGVTVLTSMDAAQLAAVGIHDTPAAEVERLGALAVQSGLTGLVCSPNEAAALRGLLGADIALVTPGIRPAGSDAQDQQRIATPAFALQSGADSLVVGRPITQAKDPAAAAQAILDEIASVWKLTTGAMAGE